MTPGAGHIRDDGRNGLRVVIDEVEHLVTPPDTDYLFRGGAVALLQDPDPAPVLRCEPRRRTGIVLLSNPDADETEHLVITVYPDHRYLALAAEVRAVWMHRLDICKVVCA